MNRDSKLKENILHTAHEALLSNHTDFIGTYETIIERFSWEGFKEDVLQNIRRYLFFLMNEEEINHLARLLHPLPLLMDRWEGSSIELFTNLPTIYMVRIVS